MMVLESGPVIKMMTLSAVVMMGILSTFMRQVASEVLYAETAPISFEVWAADLKPGFILKEKNIGDRKCYCKNPSNLLSSISSSFVFNTPATLTSSGLPGSSFDYVFITPGGGNAGNGGNTAGNINTTTPGSRTSGACGQCNMDILIDDSYSGKTYDWTSPGWSEGKNYPDGCRCVLTVRYRSTQFGALTWTFASGSAIKSVNNCAFDRLEVILNGAADTWCDTTLPSKSGSDQIMAVNADYKFTFISDFGDGNQVAKGFKLTIQGFLFGG